MFQMVPFSKKLPLKSFPLIFPNEILNWTVSFVQCEWSDSFGESIFIIFKIMNFMLAIWYFIRKNKTYIWYPRIEWWKSNIYCLRSALRIFTDESQSNNSAYTSYTRTVTVPSLGCFQQPWFNIKPYMVSLDPCVPLCINKKEIA